MSKASPCCPDDYLLLLFLTTTTTTELQLSPCTTTIRADNSDNEYYLVSVTSFRKSPDKSDHVNTTILYLLNTTSTHAPNTLQYSAFQFLSLPAPFSYPTLLYPTNQSYVCFAILRLFLYHVLDTFVKDTDKI